MAASWCQGVVQRCGRRGLRWAASGGYALCVCRCGLAQDDGAVGCMGRLCGQGTLYTVMLVVTAFCR